MKPPLGWFVLTLAMIGGAAHAQDGKAPWIGKRVFTRYGTVLKVGNTVVDDEGRTANVTTLGKDRSISRIYRVDRVNGEWLWLKDEQSGIVGWVQSKYVIPSDRAIDFYTDQIRSHSNASDYNSRAIVWDERGEYDLAIADYTEAIRLKPDEATIYYNRGTSWSNKEDYDEAIADYDQAIRLDPNDAMIFLNRGNARGYKQDLDKAIADFNEAVRLDPKSVLALHNRGVAWRNKRDFDKAIADFNEGIRIDPKFAATYASRAWVWATCPDDKFRVGKKAIESATRACELADWTNGKSLETLAASYAEDGQFDKAVEWQEKAIKLIPSGASADWQKRLDLYRNKKPYRDVK